MPKTLSDMTEPELRDTLNAAARAVKAALPPGSMFVVLAFDESNIGQYVSNVNRSDTIKTLRETADRLASREDVTR